MIHSLLRGFLSSLSSVITPTSTFWFPIKQFMENSYLFLFLLCIVFIYMGLWLCCVAYFNDISWRICICDQFNILWKKEHLGFLKTLQDTLDPAISLLGMYSRTLKTFVHIKICSLICNSQNTGNNPNVLQLITRSTKVAYPYNGKLVSNKK